MKALLVLALALLVAVAQEPPEFPPGQFCSPRGIVRQGRQTTEEPCHCKRMAEAETSCETVHEDKVCGQYCHPKSCACPVTCGHS